MTAPAGTLTAHDLAWAVETALSSFADRWVETRIRDAADRDQAIATARQLLAGWGTFSADGRVAGAPFAPPGQLSVERHGRAGLLPITALVDTCRGGHAWQEALF